MPNSESSNDVKEEHIPSNYWNSYGQDNILPARPQISPEFNSSSKVALGLSNPFIARGPGWSSNAPMSNRSVEGNNTMKLDNNRLDIPANSPGIIINPYHKPQGETKYNSSVDPLMTNIPKPSYMLNSRLEIDKWQSKERKYIPTHAQRAPSKPMSSDKRRREGNRDSNYMFNDEENEDDYYSDDKDYGEIPREDIIYNEPTTTFRKGPVRERKKVNYIDMQETWSTDEEERMIDEERKRRQHERDSTDGIDRVINHKINDMGETIYLVKWLRKAHIHNSWYTYEELRQFHGIKKVDNYIKRLMEFEERKQTLTLDELEREEIMSQLQQQLDDDALNAERVVSHQGDPNSNDVTYLIKWRACSYDQCTWETRETVKRFNIDPLVTEYFMREERAFGITSAMREWNDQPLRPNFVPFEKTPDYIEKESHRQLRDYQLVGLNWIIWRYKRGLSVLLADEMGLGKTIQAIATIGYMIEIENVIGPFLIIVPQSVIDNWMKEFSLWLPKANVVCYHGNAKARQIIKQYELCKGYVHGRGRRHRFDVCITTPSILLTQNDSDTLRSIPWYLLIIDEAHQLKNHQSKRFIELMQFDSLYKLLLSGTPLHNNLEELWALLHFLNPRLYPSYEYFRLKYLDIENTSAIGERKATELQQLQAELREIVLRRVKHDVEKSLPNKIERILRVELSPTQLEWYRSILTRNYDALAKQSGGARSSLQNICMELKKVCNHPYLCHWPENKAIANRDLISSSAKLGLLDQLLGRLKEKGNRVLIFSQMVKMLDVLSQYMTMKHYKFQRLDGTMSKELRKKAMDHFNDPNTDDFCFLLSTKAGGLGINLTTADTVIIYDSDWNPQNDLQAEARAHRIGQTKTVYIYRLITKDSIEQNILERAKSKMVLDTLVVQGLNQKSSTSTSLFSSNSSQPSSFTREELSRILKFGASKLWQTTGQGIENDNTKSSVTVDQKVDLDRVLEEAEVTKEETSGIADNLLSSYNNITEFKYDHSSKEFNEKSDKEFWESVIPLRERLKLQRSKADELLVTGPRKTRAKEGFALDKYKDMDEMYDESDSDSKINKKKKEKRHGSDITLSQDSRFTYMIYRSIMMYGNVEQRIDDIIHEIKVRDKNEVLDACNQLIEMCKEKDVDEIQQRNRNTRTIRANNKLSKFENDEEYISGIFGGSTGRNIMFEYNDIPINASELIERVKLLGTLDKIMQRNNPGVEKPWLLPTGPIKYTNYKDTTGEKLNSEKEITEDRANPHGHNIIDEESETNYVQLSLPQSITSKLKQWIGREIRALWTYHHDIALLIGTYVYGFGNWDDCLADENLSLVLLKEVKYDKIKSRVLRTLKILSETESLSEIKVPKKVTNTKKKLNTTSDAKAKARQLIKPAKSSLQHLKRLYDMKSTEYSEMDTLLSNIEKIVDIKLDKHNEKGGKKIVEEANLLIKEILGITLEEIRKQISEKLL